MPIPDKRAKELRAADKKVDDLKQRYEEATRDRGDLFVYLLAEGYSLGEIAKEIGKTRSAIQQTVNRRLAQGARDGQGS